MTIQIGTTQAATLSAADTSNNPIIAWDNKAVGATISTETGTQLASGDYVQTGTTFDSWGATPDTGTVDLQIILGSSQSISFVAIAAHNLADVSATVKPQYSTNSGVAWNDTEASSVTPTDNQAIAWYFDPNTADYWRLHITGATAATYAAVVFVGNVLTIPQRIYSGYAPPLTPTLVDLQSNVSEGGHLLGSSVVRKSSVASTSFTHIAPTFFRAAAWTNFQTHFNAGKGQFWAWRPTKYGDLHYAWRAGAPLVPQNMGINAYMQVDLEMRLYDNA